MKAAQMSVASIEDRAATLAGVTALGDGAYREGLALFLDEARRVASLPQAGHEELAETAAALLANALRIEHFFQSHPNLAEAPVKRPLFVLGLPRTGSTLVSNLLAADPARRTLLNWEAHDSIPPPRAARLHDDARCQAQQVRLDGFSQDDHGFQKIHAERADGPTECHSLTKQVFRAMWWESKLPMRGYSSWMLDGDMQPAYRFHKRALQVLQSDAPGPWALKMPSHALHIRALLDVYPDARLVWTHRDPLVAVGSLCSLVKTVHARRIQPDIAYIAANYPAQAAMHANRLLEVKDELGDDRIYDLHYENLTRDPLGEMRRLYTWLGDSFDDRVEGPMAARLAANPQGKFGRHAYSLAEFGLSERDVRPLFRDYLARFDITMEGEGR